MMKVSNVIQLYGRSIARSLTTRRCLVSSAAVPLIMYRQPTSHNFSGSRILPISCQNESAVIRQFSDSKLDINKAHLTENIPKVDYYDGHLMADHLEYIDDMIAKAVQIEESINKLQETHDKKKDLATNINWMESEEVQALFEQSDHQKQNMREQLKRLQEIMSKAKGTVIAVDAPDGTSDDMIEEDMQAVEEIINYAKEHEIKEVIDALHENEERNRQEAMKAIAANSAP